MTAIVKSARFSVRLSGTCARYGTVPQRAFRTTAQRKAAQNFSMPALSPTMTEGNIATWQVKEGESFSAGDVILEVETDKATMDVEAQEDGILLKIVQDAGSKGVKVGKIIAVLAEPGDDLSTLEIPEDKQQASLAQPVEKAQGEPEDKAPEEVEKSQGSSSSSDGESAGTSHQLKSAGTAKQMQPLYPSVERLLHEHGLSTEEAGSIKTTGPGNRLLKGDILAHLGKIKKDYPSTSSARLEKLSHLDLSNIELAKPAARPEAAVQGEPTEPEIPQEIEVTVPISLTAVIAAQKRVQDSLGIFLPLSTFISRASELANEDLPVSKTQKPTTDDLFNSVLGLDKVNAASRGTFFPYISGISAPSIARKGANKKPDLIDLLASRPAKKTPLRTTPRVALGISSGQNVFSIAARPGDERRAAAYLGRMKLTLEEEPGRLVL